MSALQTASTSLHPAVRSRPLAAAFTTSSRCLRQHRATAAPFSTPAACNSRQRSRRLQSTQAFFGRLFGGGAKMAKASVEDLKAELLDGISGLQRGVAATDEDKQRVDALAKALEAVNPNRKALASPLINGKWELLYTTSDSILGTSRPAFLRPNGPIHQFLDADNLKAANKESWPFFNQVYADLTPETDSRVAVQFKQFRIGALIPVTAPESAKGKLDTTFLDEELRVSRGDKGNLFILRQKDPSARP